jgi:acyl carrier protein
VLDQARSRFGDIHGVIHGAGTIAGESFFGVDLTKPSGCELHFKPKVRGLLVLDRLFAGTPLDFVLLVSSLSSILAGIGFVAYAAANASLDAFAAARVGRDNRAWFSVNWDNWNFDELPDGTQAAGAAMRPEEGVETFRRILAPGSPRCVAVSTTNLQARIDQWINFKVTDAASTNATAELHERPELATEHVAPRNDAEQMIANIWQELLGIQHIGVHDNFFELGGQSLLATQIVARVRTAFKGELPLRKFFESPTVAALAEAVSTPAPA